jgi:hypothetical protein
MDRYSNSTNIHTYTFAINISYIWSQTKVCFDITIKICLSRYYFLCLNAILLKIISNCLSSVKRKLLLIILNKKILNFTCYIVINTCPCDAWHYKYIKSSVIYLLKLLKLVLVKFNYLSNFFFTFFGTCPYNIDTRLKTGILPEQKNEH